MQTKRRARQTQQLPGTKHATPTVPTQQARHLPLALLHSTITPTITEYRIVGYLIQLPTSTSAMIALGLRSHEPLARMTLFMQARPVIRSKPTAPSISPFRRQKDHKL